MVFIKRMIRRTIRNIKSRLFGREPKVYGQVVAYGEPEYTAGDDIEIEFIYWVDGE